jgi:nitrite reductase/ring-hydroxylating ferredoxin subunit
MPPYAPSAASYTEGDAFQAEKRTVFSSAWLPVCHAGQIAAPGDYTSNSIGGWPVFAVRGSDGVVRAFRNVCRHQQMQVVEKPAGHCEQLRCRYHGWTYDLAGRFVTAPDPVAPADPSAPGNHLQALRTTQAHGLVLFTLGHDDAPAAAELDALMSRSSGEYRGAVTAEIGCNWKTYLEQRLASAPEDAQRFAWQWPLLIVRDGASGLVAEQVIPRTFLRTRVVFHRLDGSGASIEAEANAAKAAAETLQAERAAGVMATPNPRVAMLHERLEAALAADAGA